MNDYTKMLPALLSGDALMEALKDIPEYDASVKGQDAAVRLMKLSDIYKLYLPSQMTVEIYNKLYMATLMSFLSCVFHAVPSLSACHSLRFFPRSPLGIMTERLCPLHSSSLNFRMR